MKGKVMINGNCGSCNVSNLRHDCSGKVRTLTIVVVTCVIYCKIKKFNKNFYMKV